MVDQEVILNILEIIKTMEDGINYIEEKLSKLEIEKTMPILADIIDAFSAVEQAVIPMLEEIEDNRILEKTKKLRNELNSMVKEYEENSEKEFNKIMELSLKPSFEEWKEELEVSLRPYVAS